MGQQDPGDTPIRKKRKTKSRLTSSRNFSRVALLLLQSRLPVWCKGNDDDAEDFDDDDDGDSNDDNDDDC